MISPVRGTSNVGPGSMSALFVSGMAGKASPVPGLEQKNDQKGGVMMKRRWISAGRGAEIRYIFGGGFCSPLRLYFFNLSRSVEKFIRRAFAAWVRLPFDSRRAC